MAFCGNCGTKLADNAKFCTNCGARQEAFAPVIPVTREEEPVIPENTAEITPEETPVSETPAAEVPVSQEPRVVFHHDVIAPDPGQERVYQYVGEGQPLVEHVNQPAAPKEPAYVPPVYNTTAYDTPKTTVAAKGEKVPLLMKKPMGFGKGLLVFLLCILLLVSSIGAAAVGTVRMATRPEVVTELITGISLSSIPADLIYLDTVDDREDLIDVLHRDLNNTNPMWENLSDKELEAFIQTYVLGFAAEKVNEVFEDLYSNCTDAEITARDVEKLLEDSMDYLADECDFEMTDEMMDEIVAGMKEDEVFDMLTMEYLDDEYGEILDIVYYATSYVTMAVFGAIAALCILLLALVTKCPIRTMGATGTTMLISSIVPGVINLIPLVLPDVWVDIFGGLEYLADMVADLLATGHLVPLSILGGSIFLLIVRKILMSIRIRRK